MKNVLIIAVIFVTINTCHCGLIDGFFGTLKNTSNAIREDIGSAVSRGRSFVFGDNHEEEAVKRGEIPPPSHGLLDTVSMKLHGIADGFRQGLRNVFSYTDGEQGILSNLHDRVRNRFVKIKEFFSGPSGTNPQRNDTLATQPKIREGLKKFLENCSHPAVRKFANAVKELFGGNHNNNTKDKTKENDPAVDGTGLLDIRLGDINEGDTTIDKESIGNAYGKVKDRVKESYNRGTAAVSRFKQTSIDFVNNERQIVNNNIDKLKNDVNKLRSSVDDKLNEIHHDGDKAISSS